jgi:hypothetical protein
MRLRELARLSEVLEETCSRSQALICEPQDRSHHDPGRSGPNATPRIGLDPGHQIDDEPSGSDQHPGPSEERIRRRAPEIWGRGVAQAIPRSIGTERSVSWLRHNRSSPSRRKKPQHPARPLREWRRLATRRCHGPTK